MPCARCSYPLQPCQKSQIAPLIWPYSLQVRPCLRNRHLNRKVSRALVAVRAAQGDEAEDLASAFSRELSRRDSTQQDASERDAAADFSGQELLEALLARFGRSYDVGLVQRRYLGKQLIALNIMWKYREQASFGLSSEEYMARLDSVAAALRAWGVVKHVTDSIAASKQRPRVGKAISIMLDLPQETVREWFLV